MGRYDSHAASSLAIEMSAREYHEELWRSVPSGLEPADFAVRRRFLLEALATNQRVLDVGCGEGRFTSELIRAGCNAVGIDVAEEPLRRGRERDSALDLRLVPVDGAWELDDADFDLVWAGEVIEHVADTAAWLSEVRRVLRPDGTLLLSTPANGSLTLAHTALSRRAFAHRFDPRGDHLRFYSRDTLTGLVEDFGFERISVRAAGGVPGARRLLLARATRSRF
jgi:2-polyprenyl-3-methyl-5-hydroxy-6-metoxy-1,4-benzoquinol methylase